MELDIENSECRFCEEEFEEGDDVMAVWHCDTRRDDGPHERLLTEGHSLDFYHEGCAKVSDKRPPKAHVLEYTNANGETTTHFFRYSHRDETVRSLCGAIEARTEDIDSVRMSKYDVSSRDSGTCSTCAKKWLRDSVQ